jgi:ferredoxin-NADP reductase
MEIPGASNAMIQTSNPSEWRVGTVRGIRIETPWLRSYSFSFDSPIKHEAGQHYEIRLTAPDGYQAARLYSAAMPANGTSNMLQLTIGLMPDGEISPYVFNNVSVGSQLEIRGPLGNYFVWKPSQTDAVLLIGGGTGVIPLRCMRLMHQYAATDSPMQLLYTVDSYQDMAFKYELFPEHGEPPEDVTFTFTGQAPDGWAGYNRRIDEQMLLEVLQALPLVPKVYVCGPTPMVESVTGLLVKVGISPDRISAERFGPTS